MRYKFRVIVKYQHDQIDIFDDSCGDWRLEFNEGHEAQLLLWDYEREGWRKCDDEFEVLQFTGLQDRNGKDIYEGDILKSTLSSGQIGKVIFEDGIYKALWMVNNPIKAEYDSFLHKVIKHCEVIGNIYSNPELLEATP